MKISESFGMAWTRATLGVAVVFSGCVGAQNSSTIDAIQGELFKQQPYVEGYVQYTGPQQKWAGPNTFSMQILARESGLAKISFAPDLYQDLISENKANSKDSVVGITSEVARERLAHLATAINSGDVPYQGCLSPVRVRLVRVDGALLEKQGCRSQTGWVKAASELVGDFITASVYGASHTVPVPRAPASAPAAVTDRAQSTQAKAVSAEKEKPASDSKLPASGMDDIF